MRRINLSLDKFTVCNYQSFQQEYTREVQQGREAGRCAVCVR